MPPSITLAFNIPLSFLCNLSTLCVKDVQLCLSDSGYEIYFILILINNLSLLSRFIQIIVSIILSTHISVVSSFLFNGAPHSLPYKKIYIAYQYITLLIKNLPVCNFAQNVDASFANQMCLCISMLHFPSYVKSSSQIFKLMSLFDVDIQDSQVDSWGFVVLLKTIFQFTYNRWLIISSRLPLLPCLEGPVAFFLYLPSPQTHILRIFYFNELPH